MGEKIKSLDNNNNGIFEPQELLKSLAPGGFLTQEKNIKLVADEFKQLLSFAPEKRNILMGFEQLLKDPKIFQDKAKRNLINQTYQKIQYYDQLQYKNVQQQVLQQQAQKITAPQKSLLLVESDRSKKLDLQLMHFEEEYSSVAMNKIYNRVESNDPDFLSKKQSIEKNLRGKSPDYIKRELLSYALEKYGQLLEQKLTTIAKKAGYQSLDQQDVILKDQQLFESYQRIVEKYKNQYPGFDKIITKVQSQQQKIDAVFKKYGMTQDMFVKSQQDIESEYKNFATDPKIQQSIKIINTIDFDTATPEQVKAYMDAMVTLQSMQKNTTTLGSQQQKLNLIRMEVQKSLPTEKETAIYNQYLKTMQGWLTDPLANAIANLPNYKQLDNGIASRHEQQQRDMLKKMNGGKDNQAPIMERIQRYNNYLTYYKKENLDIASRDYEGLSQNISQLYTNPQDQIYLVQIKQDAQKTLANQSKIDTYHQTIKNANPILYQGGNLARGVREGFWKGVGGICKGMKMVYHTIANTDKDDVKYDMLRLDDVANMFAAESYQSSSMNKAVVSNGKLTMHADNTINQVGQQISNMIMLLSGGGIATKGLQGLGMGINLASKIGLMSSAMMMQTGQFFDTAIQSGLSTRDAFGYALIQGGVSAGLELISPNSAWMGNFKLNAGKLLSEANKTFVVKYMKNLTKEIGGEIAQEEMQMIAEKGMNHIFNTGYQQKLFDTEVSLAEMYSTAILTGLTTGIVSSKGKYTETKLNHQRDLYVDFVKKNPALQAQQIAQIDKLLLENKDNLDLVAYYSEVKKSLVGDVQTTIPDAVSSESKVNNKIDSDNRVKGSEKSIDIQNPQIETNNLDDKKCEIYLETGPIKVNKTILFEQHKELLHKIPGAKDVVLGSQILDLHRGETNDVSEIKSGFKALQEKLLQAKNNGEELPSHILGLSNLSFVLGKYGFSIFDSLPSEVYSQVGQYKRLFGEVDKNNPLTPAELKQKERIGQNNDGKNPIKAAMIDTESFLKLDFNETSSSESEVQGKIESDNGQTELEKNKEKENSGIKELSIEEYNQKYKKLIDYIMEKNFINKGNDFEGLFEGLQFSIEKNINKGTSGTAFYRVYINDGKQKIALGLRQGNTKGQVFENNFSPKLYENNNGFGVVEVVKGVEGSDLLTLVENNPTIAKEYAQAVGELLIEIEKKGYWLNDIGFKDGHNVMYDPETKIIKLIEPLNITNRRNNLFSHESSLIDQLLQNEFGTGGGMDISISAKGTFLFYLLKTLIDKKGYDIISNMDQPNKKAYKGTLEFQINDMMGFEYLPIQRDIEGEYVVLKGQTNKIDERVIEAIKNNDINEFKKIYENNKIVLTGNTTNTIEVHHNDYFGKESRFGFDSKQARDHSAFMDQFTTHATPEQIAQIREKIQAVGQMYTDKTGKAFTLTDAQIQAIIATHLKPGELGKLTQAELRAKVQELATAISDTDVRRFLLEAGFCGMSEKIINTLNHAIKELNTFFSSTNGKTKKQLQQSFTLLQEKYNYHELYHDALRKELGKKIDQLSKERDNLILQYKVSLRTYDEMTEGIQGFLNHFKSKRLKEDIDILEIVIGKKAVGIKDIKADYVLIEDIQKGINNHDTLISNILKVEKITSSLGYDFGLGSRIQNLLLDSLQNNTDHSFEFSLLFGELEYIKKLEDIIEGTRYSIEKDAQGNYLVLDVEGNNIIDKQTPNNDTEIIENYIRSMAGSQSTSKLSSLGNHHNMNLSNYHLSEGKNINIVRRLSFPQLMEGIGGNHIPLGYGRESVSIGNGNETFGFFSQTELNDTKKNKDIMGENQDIYKDTGIGIRYGHKDAFSEFSKEINSLYSFASEISGSGVVVPGGERGKESNFFGSQNLFTDRLWSDTKYGKIYLDMPVYDNDGKQQIIGHSVTSMFDAGEVKIYSNRLPKGTKVYVQFGQIIDGKLDIQSISNGFQTKADYDYFVQCLQDKGVEFGGFMVRDNTKSGFHTLFRDDLIVLQTNHKHMNFEQLSQERGILSKDVIKKNIEVGIKNDIVVSNINSELLQGGKNYLQKENSIKDKIKMLTNSLVFDAKNIRSAIDNDGSFSPETAKFNDYFGKESRFGFDSKQARDHSTFMDQFTTQATAEQIAQIREKIQAVGQMYTDKTGKAFTLTDAQIQAIIATHILPGQLGSLTQAEILVKNRKLAETIPDGNMRRFLLEAGFCGMEEFAVNAVNRIKSRKEKRTPMRAVLALNALIMLNSVDNVKTKILHKSIDVTQHMYTSLEKQSRDIQAVEQGFTKKIEQSKEQFDEMVSTYKNFLETVKHYNNTWLGQGINRISNGAIDETIAKAEEGKYALENTQNIVGDVNTMMQEIKTRTDASLQIAENMKNALNNAHDITDLTLNILQIISLITLLYQVFYAYGLYHSKEGKVKEQQVMMKNMKIGIVASAISLLAFYGKINPEMQSWSNEVTQQLQTLDDMIVVANSDAQNISNNQANDNYFGKESRFGFDSKQARDHSVFMDQFTGQARPEQITQIREKIQVVAQIYTDKTGKTLELTDAQIQTIIATHLKPGELGKLTQAELKVKVQELATAIPDADVRRFLLEAGFCGIWGKFQENIKTIFTNGILKSNEKVNYSNVSPDLINDYSQYHESVGVEEGYTLLEHTNMVLGQFDKYFGERFDFGVVTKNYFRDLLMIHDIGKPIAHKIGNKDDQHIYSKPLIEKILIDKGYTKNLVNFGVDLMTMDPIGGYLQGKYTLDESINIIKETYSKSGNLLSIDKYFDLLKIYYLSDTSSYTTDANGISSLDHLFDFNSGLLLNNSLQSKVDIMKNKLIGDVIGNNILNVQDRNLNLLEESEKITDMISFKSFFEKLSFEGKKSLLMDYLAKLPPIYSKEINILDISDKNCAKGGLLLYCGDRSHHMNERLEISSFGRNEVFGFLGRYFLEYGLKHNLYVTYNHNKNLYRDIIIDPDKQSDLLEEILGLHAGGIYMDKGLFSTTLKPHSTFSEEYYNEERGKGLEYFKEKAIQKVELRYQNDQLEEISNKVKKENGEAIFELDLLGDNMTSDQRRTSSLQKIHSGEFIKEVKNYAVRFIVVNSKGGIDIENNIQTVHSDKENEILFGPNKVWKVLKSKFDTKKKKILIFIDGS